MKKFVTILMLAIAMLLGIGTTQAKSSSSKSSSTTKYVKYSIGGYASISLPASFKFKGTYDEDGDGIIFSDGSAKIWVESPFYDDDDTLPGFIWYTTNEIGNGKPTLNIVKHNYFVQSGYDHFGKIYYTKAVIKDGMFYTATMKFPKSMKSKYDNIITKVFNSFPIMD